MGKKKKNKSQAESKTQLIPGAPITGRKKPFPSFSFFRLHAIPLLLIAAFAVGLYIQSVHFDYVLDDKMVITENRFTQKGIGGIGDIFRYESFRGYFGEKKELLEGDRYRPLSIASFAIEKSLGGNAFTGHLINVLLYALTGILLYRLLLFMFPVKGENLKNRLFSAPFIAAMLFIAHPLHVEVIANIKGRDEIFALLGEAGTLFFTFKYLADPKKKWLFFSFLCFTAGIFSKEGAITFLAIIPLTAYFFTKASPGRIFIVTLPVMAGTLVYLAARISAIGYLTSNYEVTNLMNNPFYGMSFGEKTATIFYTLLLYLKLHLIPYPLTHDYYPYHIPVMHWSQWQPWLSLLIHAALLFIALRGWKTRSVWSYSILFYFIALSIVSNFIVSVGVFMNERFVYHASLGFCIAMGWLLGRVLQKNRWQQRAAYSLFVIFILFYSWIILKRLPDWRSDLTLDRSALKYSPNSARSNCFYGVGIWKNVYVNLPADAPAERRYAVLDSMKPYFEKSIRILPDYQSAHTMRAAVASEYHKLNKNYDSLIYVFEATNRSGVDEKYIRDYLHYANNMVATRADAEKLFAFYSRMISFYRNHPKRSYLRPEYEKLLEEIRGKLTQLP
jgi:hypothetical protein